MLKQNPNVEKCQLLGNGTKNLLGMIEVLIFIYRMRKACRRVLGMSSAKSWFSSTGIPFERLNLGQVK